MCKIRRYTGSMTSLKGGLACKGQMSACENHILFFQQPLRKAWAWLTAEVPLGICFCFSYVNRQLALFSSLGRLDWFCTRVANEKFILHDWLSSYPLQLCFAALSFSQQLKKWKKESSCKILFHCINDTKLQKEMHAAGLNDCWYMAD